MTASLTDRLRDFGLASLQGGHRPDMERRRQSSINVVLDDDDDLDAPDVEAIAEDAFRRGRLEAFAESAALHAADLESERTRHREALEALRQQYEQDFATTLATRFDQLPTQLSAIIGAQVAATIAPFMSAAVADRIVAALAQAISDSMIEGETAEIAVCGPKGLFARLASHFEGQDVAFSFDEADELDLTIDFNGTVFATRLGEWSEALKEALA
jgi:hypothetical protein